jgi:lactoylglutathione lyase
MGIGRAHHVQLKVFDLDRSINFYSAFGFEERYRVVLSDRELVFLRQPQTGFNLELFMWKDQSHAMALHGDTNFHIAFTVQDMDFAKSELVRLGAVIDENEKPMVRGGSFLLLRDPNGYEIELIVEP